MSNPIRLLVASVPVLLFAATTALGQGGADTALVLDADASFVAADNAGAVYSVDLGAPSTDRPSIVAEAMAGAPFININGATLSPFDGRLYIADHGEPPLAVTRESGIIWSVAPDGTVTRVADDPRLADPNALAWLPDGRLLVVDPAADPSGLGLDRANNAGHGAVFAVDVTSGEVTVVADGTVRGPFDGFSDGTSAFDEPLGIAYDWERGVIWVSDAVADPLGFGYSGALYRVAPETGRVTLGSSTSDFDVPNGVLVLPDGSVLVLERGSFDFRPAILSVAVGGDVEFNTELFSVGWEQGVDSGSFSFLEGFGADADGKIVAADSGELADDGMGGVVVVTPPRIFRLDPDGPTGPSGGVLAAIVQESDALVYPTDAIGGPVFSLTDLDPDEIPDVAPGGCDGAVELTLTGTGLVPALDLDLGPDLTVVSAELVAGAPFGTELRVRATPTGGNGPVTVVATHPFGGSSVLSDAAVVVDVGTAPGSPGPPCSTDGDANCDGLVDGVDLAILGMHFGERFCSHLDFDNDADFNDDDSIDGSDLAILATFFGARP